MDQSFNNVMLILYNVFLSPRREDVTIPTDLIHRLSSADVRDWEWNTSRGVRRYEAHSKRHERRDWVRVCSLNTDV